MEYVAVYFLGEIIITKVVNFGVVVVEDGKKSEKLRPESQTEFHLYINLNGVNDVFVLKLATIERM